MREYRETKRGDEKNQQLFLFWTFLEQSKNNFEDRIKLLFMKWFSFEWLFFFSAFSRRQKTKIKQNDKENNHKSLDVYRFYKNHIYDLVQIFTPPFLSLSFFFSFVFTFSKFLQQRRETSFTKKKKKNEWKDGSMRFERGIEKERKFAVVFVLCSFAF